VNALETAKEEKAAHGEIETYHPDFLFGQDTYYVGYIKGVGKIYQQTGIDTYSNMGFAKLYSDKTAITAGDFLNDKVLPFFDQEMVRLLRVLTDRRTEYSGAPWKSSLPAVLASVMISRTLVPRPTIRRPMDAWKDSIRLSRKSFKRWPSGKLCIRLSIKCRRILTLIWRPTTKRTNQGKRCPGRTPKQTWDDGYELYKKYVIDKTEVTVEAVVH
jgi:hypothetical protein